MSKSTCPHCGTSFSRSLDRGIARPLQLPGSVGGKIPHGIGVQPKPTPADRWFLSGYEGEITRVGIGGNEAYRIDAYSCPKCGELSIDLLHFNRGDDGQDILHETISVKPSEKERAVPTEVPTMIAQDFREASRISALSLKGAATLARRCLQATLRDAFHELPKRMELFNEIEWVTTNSDLPNEVKGALHALRKAGNFGAHPSQEGLSPVYELSLEDLDSCFVLLDTLFELLYVTPLRKKAKLKARTHADARSM